LSFYAKASASSVVNIGATNFGGSQYASGTNITLTTDWVRYETQITASPIPTQTGETYIINSLDDGIDYYITGIQLEFGSFATEFDHRSFGEELQLCERYFQKNYNMGDTVGGTGTGYLEWKRGSSNTGNTRILTNLPKVRMRANPSAVAYNQNDGTAGQFRGASNGVNHTAGSFNVSEAGCWFDSDASGWSNMSGGNSGRMFITLDAEL
jgi:hypothetical protein